MRRLSHGARATIAIVLVVAAGSVGVLAAGGSGNPPAAAPGLRADLLPQTLDGAAAPAIRLRDQTGSRVDTAALTGRPYLVSFVYTRCRDVCPLIGQEIGDALRLLGPQARRVGALLVSVDPRHDTPAAARRWLRLHRLPAEAHYLLGGAETLLPVWHDWYVVPDTGGATFDPTAHDASVWLVDARGRLRGRWPGAEGIAPRDIAHDLGALLDEAQHD